MRTVDKLIMASGWIVALVLALLLFPYVSADYGVSPYDQGFEYGEIDGRMDKSLDYSAIKSGESTGGHFDPEETLRMSVNSPNGGGNPYTEGTYEYRQYRTGVRYGYHAGFFPEDRAIAE